RGIPILHRGAGAKTVGTRRDRRDQGQLETPVASGSRYRAVQLSRRNGPVRWARAQRPAPGAIGPAQNRQAAVLKPTTPGGRPIAGRSLAPSARDGTRLGGPALR